MCSRFIVLFLFFFTSLRSQAQVRVFAGPQVTTATYKIGDAKQPTDWKAGFTAGIGLTNQVEGPLYFSPQLSFSRRGYKVSFEQPSLLPDPKAKNNDASINTMALAPLLQLNFSRKKSFFFVRFGPAIEVAVSGKETFDSSSNSTVKRSMLFGPTAYSRTSTSANFDLGFAQSSGLGIFVHYELGLSSLNNADFGPYIRNEAIGLLVEWKWRRK